jgi:hypothetical protein
MTKKTEQDIIAESIGSHISEDWDMAHKHISYIAEVGPKKVAKAIKTKAFANHFRKHFDVLGHITTSSNYKRPVLSKDEIYNGSDTSSWKASKAGIDSLRRGVHSHIARKWGYNVATQVSSHVSDDDLVKLTNHLHGLQGWKPIDGIED